MAALDAAYARVREAEKFAEDLVNAAWLDFGRAIRDARSSGTKQADIARHFDREPEHIRRLQEDADVVDGLKPPPARKIRRPARDSVAAAWALHNVSAVSPEEASAVLEAIKAAAAGNTSTGAQDEKTP